MSSGFVGIVSLDVRLSGGATLKDRRSALARIRHGLAERFGAAVAEVGDLDTPWHGELTAAVVEQTQSGCDQRITALEEWLERETEGVSIIQARIVTPEDLA